MYTSVIVLMTSEKVLMTLVKVLVTMGKTINQGFLREHVILYPKFVRQWGVSGCQRSSEWELLVMNSRRMGWENSVWPPGSHQNSSSETE